MALVLRHRGPDHYGVWFDADARIGFAHIRLSILDLSTVGHQHMPSAGRRFIISFNGEIYNHLETHLPFLDHRVIEFAWRLP